MAPQLHKAAWTRSAAPERHTWTFPSQFPACGLAAELRAHLQLPLPLLPVQPLLMQPLLVQALLLVPLLLLPLLLLSLPSAGSLLSPPRQRW